MKLGPQHYPIHQWKWAGKEKKGEKKKEMLGNTSKWSVRNFVLALSLPCWSVVRWGPSEEVQEIWVTNHHSSQWHLLCTTPFRIGAGCCHIVFTWQVSNLPGHLTKGSEVHLPTLLQMWKLELSCEQGPITQSRTMFFWKRMGKRKANDYSWIHAG